MSNCLKTQESIILQINTLSRYIFRKFLFFDKELQNNYHLFSPICVYLSCKLVLFVKLVC